MRANVRERFVAALRSSEYRKAVGRLRADAGFCADGVLADLYAREHHLPWQWDEVRGYTLLGETCALPDEVRRWAGVPGMPSVTWAPDDKKPDEKVTTPFWVASDLGGWSFVRLANTVERFDTG